MKFRFIGSIAMLLMAGSVLAQSASANDMGSLWHNGIVVEFSRNHSNLAQSDELANSANSDNSLNSDTGSSMGDGASGGMTGSTGTGGTGGSKSGSSKQGNSASSVSKTLTSTGDAMKKVIPAEYAVLTIDGDDAIYHLQEKLPFHFSHGPHVMVNGTVKYFVDGKKLHLIDSDGREHELDILKTVEKTAGRASYASGPGASSGHEHQAHSEAPAAMGPGGEASVTIDSAPTGADIEIDGAFVGDTPSTVVIASGSHKIAVMKRGYVDWDRTVTITSGSIHLNADLDKAPAQK